ncbi:Clavaminate synthase-like protein [Xylaria sp. CBS 124048]|nr:Clavaminate synthase-like protein [Xylaria sp. CBS 124048]
MSDIHSWLDERWPAENFQSARKVSEQKSYFVSDIGNSFRKIGHLSPPVNSSVYDSPTSPIEYSLDPTERPLVTSRVWLRDACTCDRCVDPHSGQKRFGTADIPRELPIQYLARDAAGNLEINWKQDFFTHDIHKSRYSVDIWRPSQQRPPIPDIRPWSAETLTAESPFFPYESLMTDGTDYRNIMSTLNRWGIIFMQGVPAVEDAVEKMVQRLGYLQETFYGRTWDVVSKPNAENVAYTSGKLDFHQDLLYMRNFPRLQLLHCLANSARGGESIFCDGYRIGFQFAQLYAKSRNSLLGRKVNYSYIRGEHAYRQARMVLAKVGINWSPLFQDPIQPDLMTPEGLEKYNKWFVSIQRLKTLIENPLGTFKHRLQPGECVIFDNRRVLHGRHAFDPSSGERRLKGAYVDDDSYMSKLKSLNILTTQNIDYQARSGR